MEVTGSRALFDLTNERARCQLSDGTNQPIFREIDTVSQCCQPYHLSFLGRNIDDDLLTNESLESDKQSDSKTPEDSDPGEADHGVITPRADSLSYCCNEVGTSPD
ncbi:hypothetical protein EVAR_13598_1 [Eumeta japonica]|uniref:Uncharacterized protein n=1 Tax=Eumeta variegata TaxID=151549 RepID=A0A4C1UTB3_EUMVA|nr:hypothetical protein EVAR_13598_1 [Eumeta japonica]